MTKSKRGLRRINKLSCPEARIVYATLKPHIENADNNKNWLHNKSTLTIPIEEKVFFTTEEHDEEQEERFTNKYSVPKNQQE